LFCIVAGVALLLDGFLNIARYGDLPEKRRAFMLTGGVTLHDVVGHGNRYLLERFGLATMLKGVVSGGVLLVPLDQVGRDRSLELLAGVKIVKSQDNRALDDESAQAARSGACRKLKGVVEYRDHRFRNAFLVCDAAAVAYHLHIHDRALYVLPALSNALTRLNDD
jgi:hypothetical protein